MTVRMRAALLAAAAALSLAFLGGCGGSDAQFAYEMTAVAPGSLQVSQIAQSLMKSADNVRFIELEADSISSYYSYDAETVEEAAVYISADSSLADEIAVFKIAPGGVDAQVIAAVNSRIQSKERSFRNISPTEYDKLSNAVSVNISGYVMLAVTAHPDTVQSVIKELFYTPNSTMVTVYEEKA